MTFLAPWMLAGAAAISIPIAFHFFYRARYQPLPWAPMKFLKEAIEQTSRRLKFQEWLLLALRILAILLLALALARPGFKTAATAGRGEAIDAVLVFDTSYSMAARDGDRSRLDRAKEAALAVLDTLPTNSSVQIYGCSDRAELLGPVQRFNLDQARQLVSSVAVNSLSTDLLPGLTEAFETARTGTAPAKEIYVFTDLQKIGLERQHGALKAKCEEIRTQASLVFVRCGNPQTRPANIAVTDVALISDIPHTRTRVPFVVTLKNTGAEPVKGLKVDLELDGKSVEKDAVQVDQIEPGQTYTVMLTGSLDEPGLRVVAVAIRGDGVPGDNVLHKTIFVRDKVRVLLVDGTPNPENPLEAGDHFVKTALNPARVPDYYIESDTVTATEASPRHLEGRDIVFLLNAPVHGANPVKGMSDEFVEKLAEFVRNGGGLVIGCGHRVAAADYNLVLGSGGHKLLPFDLKGIHTTPEDKPFNPAPETVAEASFVSRFREAPFPAVLRLVGITKMFDVDDSAASGRVLVKTTGIERPFLASRVVDKGEVILVTTSLDERWGTFPSEARAFVPFMRDLVAYLTSRRVPGGTTLAGNPLTWPTPEGSRTEYELVKPRRPDDKLRPRVKLDVPLSPAGQKATVTATDTAIAGLYNIVPIGRADDAGPLFAVNPDLRETADLTVASEAEIENWLGYRPPIVQAGAGTESAVNQLRTQSEWTEWVLLFLLLLLVAEAAWAWTCGRAW